MTLPRLPATHVLRRIRQGASSSPVVVETSGGSFVVKLRGAGHGVEALIAELVVGALALTLGLPVPDRALIELLPEFTSDDKNDELADLLGRSVGLNVGFRWLDGARSPRPEDLARLDDDFVARLLWLDGLVQNLDRSRDNPNLLWWKGRPFLIDHGSALPFQYDWSSVTETSPREPFSFARHLFHDRTALLGSVDAELARRVSRKALDAALFEVPDEFLTDATHEAAERARAAYQAFLWKRLKEPRPWVF